MLLLQSASTRWMCSHSAWANVGTGISSSVSGISTSAPPRLKADRMSSTSAGFGRKLTAPNWLQGHFGSLGPPGLPESTKSKPNSKSATNYINNQISDCYFNLPSIEILQDEIAYINLKDAVIPYSFYNVNNTNNKLNYIQNSIEYSITLIN